MHNSVNEVPKLDLLNYQIKYKASGWPLHVTLFQIQICPDPHRWQGKIILWSNGTQVYMDIDAFTQLHTNSYSIHFCFEKRLVCAVVTYTEWEFLKGLVEDCASKMFCSCRVTSENFGTRQKQVSSQKTYMINNCYVPQPTATFVYACSYLRYVWSHAIEGA